MFPIFEKCGNAVLGKKIYVGIKLLFFFSQLTSALFLEGMSLVVVCRCLHLDTITDCVWVGA